MQLLTQKTFIVDIIHTDITSILLPPFVGEIRSLQKALRELIAANVVYPTDLSCFPAFLLTEQRSLYDQKFRLLWSFGFIGYDMCADSFCILSLLLAFISVE